MATTQRSFDTETERLNDGNEIPVLGLGVWQIPNGPECVDAVQWALELGYRHIDTAQAYGNEEAVGEGLRRSGIPREQVYITTKFYPGNEDPTAEAEKSLKRLGVDSIDLYIIHWPQGGATWAWPGMERAHQQGRRKGPPRAQSDPSQSVCLPARVDRGMPEAQRGSRSVQPAGNGQPAL